LKKIATETTAPNSGHTMSENFNETP